MAIGNLRLRRLGRGLATLLLAGGMSLVSAPPALAETPPEIRTFTQENSAICREAGGKPRVVEGFLTEAGDLNGDGTADYVTNLAALECENAWSIFCGSAGCPVTVWLSGPRGYEVAWSGHAREWELRGGQVVLWLHGQFCDPPRIGADSCEVALQFGQASRAAPNAPVPPSSPAAAAGSAAWRVLTTDSTVVVEGPGTGILRAMMALCMRDRPVIMATLSQAGGADRLAFTFIFPDRTVELQATSGTSTQQTYILDPRINNLAVALSGGAREARLLIGGKDQGVLSLAGARDTLPQALSGCLGL